MKIQRRSLFGLVFAAGFIGGLGVAGAQTVLNVGAYPTNPPFESKTASGAFEGFLFCCAAAAIAGAASR